MSSGYDDKLYFDYSTEPNVSVSDIWRYTEIADLLRFEINSEQLIEILRTTEETDGVEKYIHDYLMFKYNSNYTEQLDYNSEIEKKYLMMMKSHLPKNWMKFISLSSFIMSI